MRMEMKGLKGPMAMTFISNNEGCWYIIGNTAIKMAYMTKIQANAMANAGQVPKLQKGTVYSVKKGKINDIDCYVITNKMSEKQIKVATELAMKAIPEDMKKMMKNMNKTMDISSKIPAITKQYIGLKDYFIYSTEQYNKNGNKISQMTYNEVKLNFVPEDQLFQVPKYMEVKIAKTMKDYADYMVNAVSKKQEF